MGKIHVLEKQVAELIAAGEVVDRPASVIKELVENAVDAGATAITVEICRGGTTFMRVTDNGSGISRDDVPVAFIRHATSKVLHAEDLEAIGTLGFRGEALASIGAVARVEVLTRTADELEGTRYAISGGEEESCDPAGCPQGTTILVRDLFYNTPARMKFLKKDVSESNAVAAMMDRLALSHPEVSFRFLRDGKETLHTPGDGKLRSAVYAVYGKEFTSHLLPVSYEMDYVKVEGFVSAPTASRGSRSMQHFFLNGRYVRSRTAMAALEEACKGSIMVGRFPACVLYLTLHAGAVDVNVHPAKLEVRFVNERPVYDAVYHGVKSALMKQDTPKQMHWNAPTGKPALSQQPVPLSGTQMQFASREQAKGAAMRPETGKPATQKVPEKSEKRENAVPVTPSVPSFFERTKSKPDFSFLEESAERTYTPSVPVKKPLAEPPVPEEKKPPVSKAAPVPATLPEPDGIDPVKPVPAPPSAVEPSVPPVEESQAPDVRLIGEAFSTYILLQVGDGELMLIDKHAAHERLLYEKLRREHAAPSAQMLLQPVTVPLSKDEYDVLMQHQELLSNAGFECEDFGMGSLLVRSVPLTLGGDDVPGVLTEMAGYLLSHRRQIQTEKQDWLFHNVACRAAIKAGDESDPRELTALCLELYQHPDVRYCPHGRPIFVVLKKREIEKQFGRV